MAQGKWVNIPGKGRRWQQPSGELMMEKPGLGFVQAQLSPLTNLLGGIFKSSGLPAYQMSGPGLQQLRQQQTQDYYRQRGLSNLGADYKEQELAAGAAAERFRPGAGFPGQQAAADRAYESEKARVSQLTAQDPELQRYENARKAAKTQEEMNAARDIGMQIWQEKYGNTPMGQPGGAVGVTNPLMQRTFGYQTGSAPGQQIGEPTLGPSPLVPQVDQSLNPASPNYIGGEGGPLMDFTRDEVTPELIAAYQKQLLEQAAAGRK